MKRRSIVALCLIVGLAAALAGATSGATKKTTVSALASKPIVLMAPRISMTSTVAPIRG